MVPMRYNILSYFPVLSPYSTTLLYSTLLYSLGVWERRKGKDKKCSSHPPAEPWMKTHREPGAGGLGCGLTYHLLTSRQPHACRSDSVAGRYVLT